MTEWTFIFGLISSMLVQMFGTVELAGIFGILFFMVLAWKIGLQGEAIVVVGAGVAMLIGLTVVQEPIGKITVIIIGILLGLAILRVMRR